MVKVSASAIKEYENCSWLYNTNYVLKFPQSKHPKTALGGVAHEIFEILSNKKYQTRVSEILAFAEPSITTYPALTRFSIKKLKEAGLNPDEWFTDLDKVVINGLLQDFYQEGSIESFSPEWEFKIETDKYTCRGFIDRAAKYPPTERFPNGYIVIRDFKTQGQAFSKEEMNFNIQALLYQYAMHKFEKLPAVVEFVMLRHGKIQKVDWQEEHGIKGLIAYLEYVASYLADFTMEKASSNFARKDKSKWYKLGCITRKGELKKDGTLKFLCSRKYPSTIFYIKDSKGDVKYSTTDVASILLKEGETVEVFEYKGCPAWFPEAYE